MKIIRIQLILFATLSALSFGTKAVQAQTTAFTYQGQLQNNGSPANGSYDLTFTLFATNSGGTSIAGPVTNAAVAVSNGLFTTTVDLGNAFNGTSNWLELAVSTNGANSFATLAPRQQLSPTPYAIYAANAATAASASSVSSTNITGTIPLAQLSTVVVTNGASGVNLSGTFNGNGAGMTNVSGTAAWQMVTGTSQQAQPNMGYIANNSSQVTITLPASPNVGDIVRVAGIGAGGWQLAQNAGQSILSGAVGVYSTNLVASWVQTPASNLYCISVASSADGTKLMAGTDGGGLYISPDSGATWTQTTLPNRVWGCIVSSADGTKVVAVADPNAYGGGLYTSPDSGVTWTKTSWTNGAAAVASSADGTKLVVAAGGGIWTSTDSGATWTKTSAPTDLNWDSVASSADGSNLVAASYMNGGIYTSPDSGVTWTLNSATVNLPWMSVASSADGTKLVAAADGYGVGVFTSPDSGATWTQTSAPTGVDWSGWLSVASSTDGITLVAAGAPWWGIYTSTDSGATWTETSAPIGAWVVASSANGTKLVAANENTYEIWTYGAYPTVQPTTTPGTAGYLTGGQNTAIEVLCVGNGQFFPISFVGPISGH